MTYHDVFLGCWVEERGKMGKQDERKETSSFYVISFRTGECGGRITRDNKDTTWRHRNNLAKSIGRERDVKEAWFLLGAGGQGGGVIFLFRVAKR